MDVPPPYTPADIQPVAETKKPSNTISWLGFSFSLFVLLLLCISFLTIYILTKNESDPTDAAIVIGSFLPVISLPLGLAGLIFSIVGLIMAANKGGKRWMGIYGLVFSGLSILLGIFAPIIMIPSLESHEPHAVRLPENDSTETRNESKVILLLDGNQLYCYDNRIKEDEAPYQTELTYSTELYEELNVWFKMHDIENDEAIILQTSSDTDYKKISDLLMALRLLNFNNYQLKSSLKPTEGEENTEQ